MVGGVKSFHVKPNLGYVRLSCGCFVVLTIKKSEIEEKFDFRPLFIPLRISLE